MSELKLQSQCFQWHWNSYPEHRGTLYMNYNNAKNREHGAILKAMGMLAGVADLTLLTPKGAVFIEMKIAGGKQSPAQKEWQSKVESLGYRYELCYTFERFQEIVKEATR
jgi:hypothetical protein